MSAQNIINQFESMMGKPVEMVQIIHYAKALESAGRNRDACAVLKGIYQQAPGPDTAKLYATTLVRVGERDNETVRVMAKRYPNEPILKAVQSEMALCDGDYETGFKLARHRWAASTSRPMRDQIRCREWDGHKFDGPLLVIGEQGIGEELMYSSSLRLLPEGQRCIVAADQRLHPMLARSFPQHTFVHKSALRHYAHDGARVVEAMQLAGMVKHRGNHTPWIKHDQTKTAAIRKSLQDYAPGKIIIGLSWFSNRVGLSADKSIPPADLLPVLSDPRYLVVNLQYGDISADAQLWNDAGHQINTIEGLDVTNDLDGLASLCAACDVVLTSSNSTAHLAGSIGAKTVLITHGTRFILWFWGRTGNKTPWYPSIEIVRATNGYAPAVLDAIALIDKTNTMPDHC